MKIALIGTAIIAAAAGTAVAQDSIAYWAQNDNTLSGGGFGFEDGDFPQLADFGAQAGSATLEPKGGLTGSITGGVYDFVQSFSGSTTNAQFGEGSGGSIALQGGTNNGNNGAWIDLDFDGSSYTDILFSFAGRGTGTGFKDVDIDAYNGDILIGSIAADIDLTGGFALYNFSTTLLNNVTDARIRMTFDGASSTTGNNRLDNLFIQGTIPTPASAVLLGLGGLAAVRRRR